MNDYVGTLVGIPELNTAWFLDPFVGAGTEPLSSSPTPVATGNQVSCEFNLVYRFHMIISDRDDKWTQGLFKQLFPGKDPETMSLDEFMQGLLGYLASVDPDPAKRELHITSDIVRGPDGTFPDAPMIQVLTETTEDCAGSQSQKFQLLICSGV